MFMRASMAELGGVSTNARCRQRPYCVTTFVCSNPFAGWPSSRSASFSLLDSGGAFLRSSLDVDIRFAGRATRSPKVFKTELYGDAVAPARFEHALWQHATECERKRMPWSREAAIPNKIRKRAPEG
jgi:hypothetical protein